MPNPYTQGSESITQAEHIGPNKTGDNIQAKKVANYIWDTNSSSWIRQTASSGGGGGGAVTIADGDDVALGAKADASATTDTGTFSLISLFKRLLEKVTTLVAKDFSTSAKQDTIIGHVDGIEGSVDQIEGYLDGVEGLLTTIDGDTGTIATEVAGLLTDTELRATPVLVSGTVTATPTGTQNVDVTANTIGLATSANLTSGTQQTKLTDGTNTVAVGSLGDGDSSRQSLVVDARVKMYNGTSFDRIRGDTTNGLLVNLGANNDVTVTSGAITETNSAAIKTAVELIDNAISGAGFNITQLGGAAVPIGAGTEAAAVRVTLPTNGTGIVGLAAGTNNIGDVDVLSSVSATLDHGSNLDIDTSAEQITSTSFACKFGVTVKSAVDNTDTVYIGNSDVTAGTTGATDGFPLEPGESITLPVNNSNLLYAIGAAANQKVFWSAV